MDPIAMISKWPMMSSWYPITFITLGYLYFIYIAGPRYMKSRPPYNLKTFIYFYNIFQVLINMWIVEEYIRAGCFTTISLICGKIDFVSPSAKRLISLLWWVVLLKIFDYTETCLFVLRKKQNQISVLHVYHHVSVATHTWCFLKYAADIRASFIFLLNCFIHIWMYIYYFCAAYGPRSQRILAPLKPYLTIIQMVQFFGILLYIAQSMFAYCEISKATKIFAGILAFDTIIYILLFYNFYKKNYHKNTQQKI